MEKNFIIILREKIKKLFINENTGHDISHLERVRDIAMEIQKIEGGDKYIIETAALVHDIHRLMSNELGTFVPAKDSLSVVEKILTDCNVDKTKLPSILEVVKFHDDKSNKNLPLETLIIQDADVIDALGEVGLKRTLTFCKTHNIPISNTNYPLDCKEYVPNTNPISTCHYVYRTMIPEGKNLYTNTAKNIVYNKIEVLEKFIKENYK